MQILILIFIYTLIKLAACLKHTDPYPRGSDFLTYDFVRVIWLMNKQKKMESKS